MTAAETEIKTAIYRILCKHGDDPPTWIDFGNVKSEGRYSARPSAEFLGERFGEGQYMYFEAEKHYATVEFITVVAETVYREMREEVEVAS